MFKENILEEMKMKRKNILKKFESISVCSALNYFYDISEKTVDWLAQYSIKANAITLGGLFFAVLGVNFLAMEYYFSALVCLLLNRWCDVLDGISARRQEITAFGAFFDIAAEMDDCISLGVGEPDFKTPWRIRDAGIKSLQKGKTTYTANAGLKELRQEISGYMQRRFGLQYDPLK